MKKIALTLKIMVALFLPLKAQETTYRKVCELPSILKRSSGLFLEGPNSIWTHNDMGIEVLYNIDTTGKIMKTVHINHPNKGWKDITEDSHGNIYIGNFSNKGNQRKDLKIYKIPNPSTLINNLAIDGETISFHLSDQKAFPPKQQNRNFDIESMISFQENIYLFTKNRSLPLTGYCKVYRVPNAPGEYSAELLDSVFMGKGNMASTWVTSASLSPDKTKLALLTNSRVVVFYCFQGDAFFKGKSKTFELKSNEVKEAITFAGNEKLYISEHRSEENLKPGLYCINLENRIRINCN